MKMCFLIFTPPLALGLLAHRCAVFLIKRKEIDTRRNCGPQGPQRLLGPWAKYYGPPACVARTDKECVEDLWKLLQELEAQREHTVSQRQSVKSQELSQLKHPNHFQLRNYWAHLHNIQQTGSTAPVCQRNVSTVADSCPVVLYQLLLENLSALPRQGEGASPPFWLLFSSPALSQHSVSSSQSPCQQDFTQWPGELQSRAQLHTHTHTQQLANTLLSLS